MGVAAVVLAGGSGTRLGADRNKVYLDVGGRPLLAWSLRTFDLHPAVDALVVVARPGDHDELDRVLAAVDPVTPLAVVAGGATRTASERAALAALAADVHDGAVDVVLVHDGARPFADLDLVDRVLDATGAHGAAIPALAVDPPLWRLDPTGPAPVDVGPLRRVQTPQGAAAAPLLVAFATAGDDGFDTAQTLARGTGIAAATVAGDERNLKITTAHDLATAETLAARFRDGRWLDR